MEEAVTAQTDPPSAGHRLRKHTSGRGLAQLVVALASTLLGTAYVQWRQYALLADGKPVEPGIALILFQFALLLALGVVVLRQRRAALRRGMELEVLAGELDAARLDAEAASRAKSVFLASMKQEIHAPFHGMLGMMSLLQETPLNAQQASYVNGAKESASRLLSIVNDIVDIAQLESGHLKIAPQPVDLARLVREADAAARGQAQAKGLDLAVTMGAGVARWVLADAARLKQILVNLLSNAVKFTAVGHVHMNVEAGVGRAAGSVAFSVIDTGIGMDAATQTRILLRLTPGERPWPRLIGTELGLELSHRLARLMNGHITMSSVPGEGSTFTLTLPLPEVSAPEPGTLAPSGPVTVLGHALKVLVAEDHPVNRAYLEAVLDKLGHQAVFAENGEEAVYAAQEQDFDVVLMDLHMPLMDGFAAARAIRALPMPRGAMPIVALTADAFEHSEERAREAGMDDMLTKPAHLPQLRELLARYGGASRTAAATTPAADTTSADIVDRGAVEQLHATLSAQKYTALLGSFFDTYERTFKRVQSAADTGQRSAVWEQAHALKGAALSLGLRAIAEQADGLKHAAIDPTRPSLTAPLQALGRHLVITRDLCQSLGWLPCAPPADRTVH